MRKFEGVRSYNTHPLAYADEQQMNVMISQHEEFVPGARVTGHNWDAQAGLIQFFYSIPDGLSIEKELKLESAIKMIISQFPKES